MSQFKFRIIKRTFLFLTLVFFTNVSYAAVAPVVISTDPDRSIRIDLSFSITGVTDPIVTLITQPQYGTAAISGLVVIYTPNQGVTNVSDTFEYGVVGTPDQATITVNIGDVATQGESPPAAVEETFRQLCFDQEPTGELIDFCQPFLEATAAGTPEDLREFLDALSPMEIAAQTDLGSDMARQQVEGVLKRLGALRKGMTDAALGNLVLNINNKSFTWDHLRNATGGAASADQQNIGNFGWYLNGNLKRGDQDESDKEDAYSFYSGNLLTGIDYRFSNVAVVGGALGIGDTAMEIDNDGGEMDVTGMTSTFYASFFPSKRINIDLVESYSYQEFSASRRIVFGQTDAVAESSTDSDLFMSSLGVGLEALNAGGFTWSMSFRADYLKTTISGYEETGNSNFNLSIEERTVEQITSDFNNSFSQAVSFGGLVAVFQFDLSWIHQYKDDAENIRGSFVSDPNNTIFQFKSDQPDTDYFKIYYGFQTISPGGKTFFLQLSNTLGKENYFDTGLAAGFRAEF